MATKTKDAAPSAETTTAAAPEGTAPAQPAAAPAPSNGTAAGLAQAAPPSASDQTFTLADMAAVRASYEQRLEQLDGELSDARAQLLEAYEIVGQHTVTIRRLEKAGLAV